MALCCCSVLVLHNIPLCVHNTVYYDAHLDSVHLEVISNGAAMKFSDASLWYIDLDTELLGHTYVKI